VGVAALLLFTDLLNAKFWTPCKGSLRPSRKEPIQLRNCLGTSGWKPNWLRHGGGGTAYLAASHGPARSKISLGKKGRECRIRGEVSGVLEPDQHPQHLILPSDQVPCDPLRSKRISKSPLSCLVRILMSRHEKTMTRTASRCLS